MTKTDINLYTAQFRPTFVWLTLNHLFLLVALALLLMGGLVGGVLYQNSLLDKKLVVVQSQLSQKQQTVMEMTNALTQKQQDPKLLALAQNLENIIQEKESLIQELKRLDTLRSSEFSEVLNSLSKVDKNELWLTNISVVKQDVQISGELSNPLALPLWIRSLSQTEFFNNMSFNKAQIARTEDDLQFSISTSEEFDQLNGGLDGTQ